MDDLTVLGFSNVICKVIYNLLTSEISKKVTPNLLTNKCNFSY